MCVCVRARACVRARMCAHARACMRICVCIYISIYKRLEISRFTLPNMNKFQAKYKPLQPNKSHKFVKVVVLIINANCFAI